MPRFYCAAPVVANQRVTADDKVAQHVRVLRLREGDAITLFDGSGGEVPATVASIGKREVLLDTAAHAAVEREASRAVTLYAALIANDRMDWTIQKATELGVAAIQPVYSERSQRIPGDVGKRVEHWLGVAIAACEQCGRNRIPSIAPPVALARALELTADAHERNVLLDAEAEGKRAWGNAPLNLFVGPEGGFASAERPALQAHCALQLRIGATVLRAETAAIAALAAIALG